MAAPMNVMAAVRSYVDKIVGDPNCPGMKVLLLDEWTTKTVAMVYSQTEILDRDVYLVERLDQVRKPPLSAVFRSFRLIFGRVIIPRSALEARMLLSKRARAEHSR
jgi:hypothetical protein